MAGVDVRQGLGRQASSFLLHIRELLDKVTSGLRSPLDHGHPYRRMVLPMKVSAVEWDPANLGHFAERGGRGAPARRRHAPGHLLAVVREVREPP